MKISARQSFWKLLFHPHFSLPLSFFPSVSLYPILLLIVLLFSSILFLFVNFCTPFCFLQNWLISLLLIRPISLELQSCNSFQYCMNIDELSACIPGSKTLEYIVYSETDFSIPGTRSLEYRFNYRSFFKLRPL